MKKTLSLMFLFLFMATIVFAQSEKAIDTVLANLSLDELDRMKITDLRSKDNPKSEGIFVYVPQDRFYGVKRNFIWLVIEGQAYPLNGPSKKLTPSLTWPREAPEAVWDKTGLNPYVATEAIEIVFENNE